MNELETSNTPITIDRTQILEGLQACADCNAEVEMQCADSGLSIKCQGLMTKYSQIYWNIGDSKPNPFAVKIFMADLTRIVDWLKRLTDDFVGISIKEDGKGKVTLALYGNTSYKSYSKHLDVD